MTIRHLIDSNDTIYPLTIISRNDLIQHMKKRRCLEWMNVKKRELVAVEDVENVR